MVFLQHLPEECGIIGEEIIPSRGSGSRCVLPMIERGREMMLIKQSLRMFAVGLIVLAPALADAQVVTLAEAARAAAAGQGASATVTGIISLPSGTLAEGLVIRLRDAVTGEIRQTTLSGPVGEFPFQGDSIADDVILEVLDQSGTLLGVSSSFSVGPGEVVGTFMRVTSQAPILANVITNTASAATNTLAGATPNLFTETAPTIITGATGGGVTGIGPVGPAVSGEL